VGQWRSAESVSPYSGGTVPESHRVPSPLTGMWTATLSSSPVQSTRWVPVIACATLIFALSGTPGLSTGLGFWDLVLRKLAHAAIYAVLGLLLVRAWRRSGPSLLAGVAFAASDELHQHFVPGRVGAPLDVAIDTVGLLVGVTIAARRFGL